MRPAPFDHIEPRTVAEAVATLGSATGDCRVLAGGQSLLPLLNLRRVRPDTVVDINRVAGLDDIHVTMQTVRIGALTRLRGIERDTGLSAAAPVLGRTAALVGHPQIRTRATLGGSLCHADPAAQLPAVAVALNARLHLESSRGARTVDAESFFTPDGMTCRAPDELLIAVEFARRPRFRLCFEEVRRGGGFPLVGLCFGVAAEDGGVIGAARVVGAGLARRPLRLRAVERALVGRRLSDDLDAVLAAVSAEPAPGEDRHGGIQYRRALLRTLLRRATARLATVTS